MCQDFFDYCVYHLELVENGENFLYNECIKKQQEIIMAYEMIVLDLDGTLTNKDKIITARTKDVLMKAQEQGKKVVLASGRPTYGVMPLAEELDLASYGGYILSFNGGIIINCKTREVVFSRQLPVESNERIVDLAVD